MKTTLNERRIWYIEYSTGACLRDMPQRRPGHVPDMSCVRHRRVPGGGLEARTDSDDHEHVAEDLDRRRGLEEMVRLH